MKSAWISLVPRPHPLIGRNGLVNEVKFLGLEAYYGMCNHCIIPWCKYLRKCLLKAPMSTKHDHGHRLLDDVGREDVLTFCRSPMAHRRLLKHPLPSIESASRLFGGPFRHSTGVKY